MRVSRQESANFRVFIVTALNSKARAFSASTFSQAHATDERQISQARQVKHEKRRKRGKGRREIEEIAHKLLITGASESRRRKREKNMQAITSGHEFRFGVRTERANKASTNTAGQFERRDQQWHHQKKTSLNRQQHECQSHEQMSLGVDDTRFTRTVCDDWNMFLPAASAAAATAAVPFIAMVSLEGACAINAAFGH